MTEAKFKEMIVEFINRTGKDPTHWFCTAEEQDELSKEFHPRNRLSNGEPAFAVPSSKIVSYIPHSGLVIHFVPLLHGRVSGQVPRGLVVIEEN